MGLCEIMFDEEHLTRAMRGIGVTEIGELFRAFTIAYSGANRHYHNRDHIADCLTHFREIRELAEHPDEVDVAIWFHDGIYDSRRRDNEEQSAAWARKFLEAQQVDANVIARIEPLILVTKTHAEPVSVDQQLMVDVDLRILGETPERFEAYDQAIRAEYTWVPENDYRRGRAEVLQSFLNRKSIYQTECFRAKYEHSARENLARTIAELQ